MSDQELELFDPRAIWMYNHCRSKEKYTEEDFNSLKACIKYILQVEAGEVKSNIKKLNNKYLGFSILWAILSAANIRSSYIIIRDPATYVFEFGIPVLLVTMMMISVLFVTLFAIYNLAQNIRMTRHISRRRKTAKRKLELLEQEVYSDEAPYVLDHKYLALAALDAKMIGCYVKEIKSAGSEEVEKMIIEDITRGGNANEEV